MRADLFTSATRRDGAHVRADRRPVQGQTYFGYPNRTGLAAFLVPDPNGALSTIFVQGGPGGVQSETLITIGSVYRSSTNDCHFQIQSITTHT